MTSVAPAGEGGGGGGGAATSSATAPATTTSERAPSPPAAQQSTTQPQQHPPPSPLSGCYLLVVLPEPHTAQHKDLILNRLAKGFLSWDKDNCHVDLEKELQALVAQSPEGEEARNGERLIQYATENLVTEVLIYPQSNTLLQCIRNLLASFTKHRHIIHAGYTFGGNGSWILQDGTFSLADFLDAFSEHEVQRVLRAYENSVTVDIHCAGVGDWTTSRLSKEACTRACRVRVNPDDVLTAGVPAITSFVGYIGQYLIPQTLDQLMEPSDVVGNIRFSHPTLYVFPGGQGDAALFGINGFNMLVDGGFARKACFWDFVRHLDRLDAVLVTRINNSNVGGMSSVIRKKKEMHVYPQIGHFFCNLVERKHSNSPDGDKDIDPLILNLIDAGQEMMVNLRHINLRPHPCYRDPEPINLYHKVGHGTLDMYVLSPSKDSREVREFMSKWNASDSKLFAGSHRKDSNSILFPVQNLVSICALLVWQPANPEDTITRILFPGSTPQHKIFEGFERLKHLEFLKRPVCTAKSLSPSTSLATLKEKAAILKPKLGSIERETKRLAEMRKEKRDLSENKAVKKDTGIDDATAKIIAPKPALAPTHQKTESKAKKVVENKKIESESKESKMIENGMKEIKKEVKKIEKSEETKKTDLVKVETEKTAPVKELKTQKVESKKKETKEATKPIAKPTRPDSTIKTTTKPMLEKKSKPAAGEKKDIMKPSPTTPKKSINGAATKTEISKTVTKSMKVTSKTTSTVPAKSAKDANNRMVVEQKNIELSSKSAADSKGKSKTTTTTASGATTERKPVTRRQPKPLSPNKARHSTSPSKSAKSTPSSIKSEKDAVIRKIKSGTTDSSTVSTPSGIDIELGHKLVDRNLTEKSEDMSLDSIESKVLADLKEEREVVEEIEAVLQKAERIEGTRKQFERDEELATETVEKKEEDVTEEDVTAEMDDVPKKISRKESQELTEEDEYLIVEKEEIFTEDSVQSGDTEQKHHLDEVESEKTRIHIEHPAEELSEHDEEKDIDEKKDETPEKKLVEPSGKEDKKSIDLSPENKEILEEEMKQIIASATEAIQKTEEKDDSARKDSEDITKEPSSISPEKFDSPGKQDTDQKESMPEKLEESQERISTLESGATTTAPTLPDDERVPLDEIKEELEKHVPEEVKEKAELVKEKEILPEMPPPTVPKPEVKILDVKPPLHGIARDIVKTPDEVADLPVHEEVDPKLYRMDDLEKVKDVKISPQDTKEFPTPPKDKGVFSFFGKVADTFEKGIDKLTKKGRRDSQKDADDKSSKSSSPKEPRPQDQMLLEDIDINKVFPKVSKYEEALDSLVKAKQEIRDAICDIDATTALLQEDIKDAKTHEFGLMEPHHIEMHADVSEKEVPLVEVEQEISDAMGDIGATTALLRKDIEDAKSHDFGIIDPHHIDKHAEALKKEISLVEAKQEIKDAISDIDATTALLRKDIEDAKSHDFGIIDPHHIDKHVEILEKGVKEEVVEDIQEVEALMEEASKKFKHVKDSLQDSLESLEDKIDGFKKAAMEENDSVKDVLAGVAEKLEDIADIKEPEKVKFSIPESSEDFEADDEDSGGIVRDFKEAVRDVAEVLVGTAGIQIEKEEKPKDVEGIVKKVAEVLKEDDLLSEKALSKSIHADEAKAIVEETVTVRDVKDQVADFIRKESIKVSPESRKMSDVYDAIEEPFTKTIKSKELVSSPVKDDLTGLEEAKILCEDMLKDDCIREPIIELQADTRADVMDLGLEEVCVKKVAKRDIFEEKEKDEDKIIIEPEIGFQQNLSPGKAELVTVTPGSTPTSPKLTTEAEFSDVLPEFKDMINKETNLENIIEEFIVKRNHKITLNIIEYIVIVKRVPKEKVINIIQEIIIKHKIPRESVADRIEILRLNDDIPTEKRTQIESDITKEYLNKNKKINSSLLDEIAKYNRIPKRIVIEVIEEIIVRKKFPRESVFDISEESYFTILKEDLEKVPEGEVEKQDFLVDVSSTIDSIGVSEKSIDMPPSAEEVDDKIVDGFVSISSKDAVEAFLLQEKESSQHDDFEAVEQEYKVKHDSTLSPKTSIDDQKPKATEEVSENVVDVMDTDEKFVRETAEKSTKKDDVPEEKDDQIKHAKKEEEDPSHDVDISEVSEADAKEKYLDEAKEKTSDHHGELLSEEKDTQESAASVKRMVVTASSEDGGQETEICPSGTITFTKNISSETENTNDAKTTLIDKIQTHEIPVSIPHALDTGHSPDSLQSEDASPAESVFSKSPIEKTSPTKFESVQIEETSISDANEKVFHITEKISITECIVEEGKLVSESHSTFIVEDVTTDNFKFPSLEKEIPEKSADVGQVQHALETSHETEFKDSSKSLSAEKEIHTTEVSPKKSTTIDDVHVATQDKDRSKSPGTDKEVHPQEASSEMPTDAGHAHLEIEFKDRSKSPSVEKETRPKELSSEKIDHAVEKYGEIEVTNKPKSPSVEKEVHHKESSPEKSSDTDHKHGEIEVKDGSKSPSQEKEMHLKEASPERLTSVEHLESEVKDRSKSPSQEKEGYSKEPSPEKSTDAHHLEAEVKDRSKSPSQEIEIHAKEASPEKSTGADHLETEVENRSKSPSIEKEIHSKESSPEKSTDADHKQSEIEVKGRSKSPSQEKEIHAKEASPEKSTGADHLQAEVKDRSKSPSQEKEIHSKESSPEKSTDSGHLEAEVKDRTKSPNQEKEIHPKEPSPEKSTDSGHLEPEVEDRSKSPSVEKEIHAKEGSPEKTTDADTAHHVAKLKDRSKSPSQEKEIHPTESSPEKSTGAVDHLEPKVKDRSKSPSQEKEIHSKEPSPEKSTDSGHLEAEVKDRSKSPSQEKEIHPKESSPEKSTGADHLEAEVKDRSKSPSQEKEIYSKESSPEKSTGDDHLETGAKDRSKSPSEGKEIHAKEASPEKSIGADHPETDVKDESKSPSQDKVILAPGESTGADHSHSEPGVKGGLKSSSAEKEIHSKKSSPEKSIGGEYLELEVKDRSKSPSQEKEIHPKEPSPEKSIDVDHLEAAVKDRSKSSSVEKEMHPKEPSPEKSLDADHVHLHTGLKGRSPSPSVEKDIHSKESSPVKSTDADKLHGEVEIIDGSKSPSGEKEMHPKEPSTVDSTDAEHLEAEVKARSKSPSLEKEIHAKEGSPEKTTDADPAYHEVEVKDGSKSPSAEKEIHPKDPSPEKSTLADHLETEVKNRSKSPSVEKDIHLKEPAPEKSTDADHSEADVKDKSKSSSVEKETPLKEVTFVKSTDTDHVRLELEGKDKSKSPSVEREIHPKVPIPEKLTDAALVHFESEIKDSLKSSSAEEEVHSKEESIGAGHAHSDPGLKGGPKSPAEKAIHSKEPSPEKSTGADHVHHECKVEDRSKSPSAEREMQPKDAVTDHAHDETEIRGRSKSPTVEKDEPEKLVDASDVKPHEMEVEDGSKSPGIEKETSKMESVLDKLVEPIDATKQEDTTDQSKSPSIEKDISVKQDTIDFIHFEKVQYSAGDTIADKTKSPISEKAFSSEKFPLTKSPTPEREFSKKESSLEKGAEDRKNSTIEITSQITERSRSSSISTESHKKEIITEKNIFSEELKVQVPVSAPDEKKEKSKSPSVERDVSHHEELPDKSEIETSRKDSLLKKDIDNTKQILSDAVLSHLEDISRSSSIIADITKDSDPSSKSRSGSIQSVIDHGISSLTSEKDKLKEAKSRTGSISESITSETRIHGSKSPSPEKVDVVSEQFSDTFMEKARLSLVSDKFDEDSLDRTKSPSVLSDKSDEKDIIDRSKSPSVVGDKFDVGQTEDSMKEQLIEEKAVSSTLSGPQAADKHESDKSKSVSPVGEKIHSELTGDRKASVTSIGSHAEDKGKDRSRSHSLFDTGDKTPLVRSRAASLYDEKLVEKVSLLEHGKDSTGHSKDIFEEENEFRSSQETLGDIHKDIPRRNSKESDSLNAESKQAIENYILNEYIHKNKVITLACINEVTAIYKVDRYVVIKIVNELITNLKLKQEKLVEIDEDEHDEENQKLVDIEENLMNYINEEFVSKKKKINSKTIDDIASSKSVPRPLVILVIENIILSRNLPRESVVDFDLSESQEILKKDMGADDSANKPSRKPSTEKMPEKVFVKDTLHKSKSASPELSSSANAKTGRPEPPMDEEIIISENKREEIESLIIDGYVNHGVKINEAILENIIARTAVPKYIIIEIIQEIIVKKLLSRNVVADEIIFSDDDLDDTPQKLEYGEPSHSEQYDEHRLDKSMPYSEYESPFHKAFMEGMTEIRTTHITTLSGKSTPDFGQREGTPESSEVTSTITRTITSVPGEYDQEDDAQDRIVILKTTQITTYPEDDQKITREFVQSLPGSSDMQKIEEEPESRTGLQEILSTTEVPSSITSKIEHSEGEHEITEIVTAKIIKTIITETEMDPITKITKIISETPSETTTTTTTHGKFTIDSKSSQDTAIPTTCPESHVGSTSKTTVVTSSTIDSGKSTPDIKHEEQVRKSLTGKDLMEHTVAEQMEQSVSPVIRDLISDDRSYSGKSSPDVSLPKDIAYGDSTGKSTPELSMSPLIRDGTMIQSHFSGRSTPDRRSDNRSRTATPEGFRSGEVIRTIITTTRTISDDGDLITTTQEVTETTNEKGETVVLATKTDVKVDEAQPDSLLGDIKSADAPRTSSPSSEKDKDPTSPRSDLSSGHSRAPTHMWESSEERHTYSDEDPSSPLFSLSPHHPDPRSSMKEEASKAVADFSSSAMSSSFYGQLPEEVAHFTSTITKITESHPEQDFTFRKLTVEKEYAGGYTEKDSKKYVDDADLDFEKALTASVASSSKELAKSGESKSGNTDDKEDPLAGWGSPLKLPSPKAPRKFNLKSPIQPTSSADLSPDSLNFDVINDWGEPMRLPSPAPTNEVSNKGSPGTPKKERDQARKVLSENAKNKQRSQSPSKQDKKYKNAKNKVQPIYVDLTYVPHHGNSFYTALDFFKKIRARYYVFSGTEPSREVYDALLEAKKTWEDKDLEVTLIPTYDTDTLGYWVADNEEALAANHIDLSPSASRCTINLQDHETSCSAYRLEF